MANKALFESSRGALIDKADATNEAGGTAYRRSDKAALAQYAATGCLNGTYYASGGEQLETVLQLTQEVDTEFIAKTAVYARERGHMKDTPALLCAILSTKNLSLLAKVFPRVIDNAKMLRNFVQIMRSGVVGRKSLGTAPKRLILEWLESHTDDQIFRGSVGNDPSMADIIKMVHPKPTTTSRDHLYGYLTTSGVECQMECLPPLVREYERYRKAENRETLPTPNVPFQMLTSLDLGTAEWIAIARQASWQMTRMNLNTFARHGVFEDKKLVGIIADRLRDRELIGKARVFPYQLMMAYKATADVPHAISEALQDAMEIAVANVPKIDGKVYVFPDVSGSMTWSSITGQRAGATSAVRCVDVAALVAAALLRTNPSTTVIPFETKELPDVRINPRDTVLTNAERLASVGGGGTNCSAPLAYLNATKAVGDLIVYVSDNESWIDSSNTWRSGTETMVQWAKFKVRNVKAKMVCIDLTPSTTSQAVERDDIINVGGFSDQVFDFIAAMASGEANADYWVGQIEDVVV